jgi:hypothetical protein
MGAEALAAVERWKARLARGEDSDPDELARMGLWLQAANLGAQIVFPDELPKKRKR